MLNLTGKLAVITGASGGIGSEIAIELAKKNMNLCLVGRDLNRLKDVKDRANKYGIHVSVLNLDLCSERSVIKLGKTIKELGGSIDVLVHSAGVISYNEIENLSINEFRREFNINMYLPFILTKLLLVDLKKAKGQIVFINSTVIKRSVPRLSAYTSSKQALKGFADCLREEVNRYGVRVLSIFPGKTASKMQLNLHMKTGKEYNPEILIQPNDIAQIVSSCLLLPKSTEVTEVFLRPMMKS